MLSKISFKCTGACLLAALVLMLVGCSGSGTPITPDIQEITIISPTSGSEWGSPPGVWEIAFSSPHFDVDGYDILIDNIPVISCSSADESFQDLEDGKGILAHVVVPVLSIGDHQLMVEAKLFDQVIARGTTTFVVKPERELTVEITNPTPDTDWDIGDSNNEITWETSGDQPDSFQIYYSVDNGISWEFLGESSGSSSLFLWTVPVVDNAGASTFKIRVDAKVRDSIIASNQSDAFRIDYGPLATMKFYINFLVDQPFAISAQVFDKYNNPIINYTHEVSLSLGDLSPNTLGNGSTTGTWHNGSVTHNGYLTSYGSGACMFCIVFVGQNNQTSFLMNDVLVTMLFGDETGLAPVVFTVMSM